MIRRRGRRKFEGETGWGVKEARVDVVLQRVEEEIGEEITAYPQHVRRFGVNNIFQRTFAYLLGWQSNGKPKKVAVTSGGLLKVAISGAGFEQVDTLEGTAGVNWSSALEFVWTPNRIRFEALDYPYIAKFSIDGVTWSDEIYVDGDMPRDFDINAKYVKVRRYGGTDATYWIIGMR